MLKMESPSRSCISGLKRKSTESCEAGPCKAPRIDAEHGASHPNSAHCRNSYPTRPPIVDSCFNYLNSGLPHRILFRYQDEWLDFSEPVVQTLIEGFKAEKSSVTLSAGGEPLLFDFLSMVLINLRTREQLSVAWIDEYNKCFFPTSLYDDEADEYSEWIFGIAASRPHGREVVRAFGSPPEVVKRVVMESEVSPRPEILRTKIEKLERDDEGFLMVQKLFLSGMGPFATPQSIVQVLKCVQKDNIAQMRLNTFERQMSSTVEERGDGNVQYGWFGSNKTDIVGILIHGFGMAGKPIRASYGTGIYLTPENRAFASVNLCDVDEKGMQHMLLCRVVMGNMEQVSPRSMQYLPSSEEFDSGVDNISSPSCYVVWPAHMNSYIQPEYVVTFKLTPQVRDYLFTLKDVRFHVAKLKIGQDFSAFRPVRCETVKGPNSPWLPFTTLFEVIHDSISPVARELLYQHYDEMKRKILTREDLVKKMRLIIGDQLLVSTLQRLQHSPASWYCDSNARETKLYGCTSSATEAPVTVVQKMEPNASYAVKTSCYASTVFDLNDSAGQMNASNVSAAMSNDSDAPQSNDSDAPLD